MKKGWFILFVIIFLGVASIYIFIPGEISLVRVSYVKANQNATLRSLSDKTNWVKWWPSSETKLGTDTTFSYKNVDYAVNKKTGGSIIKYKKSVINSELIVLPFNSDSIAIAWKSQTATGLNPLQKINSYFYTKKIKQDIGEILESLKLFLEKPENIYSLKIKEERVKDTLLIATRSVSKIYPSTQEIYALVKRLRDYIFLNKATETNYPMLHVTADSGIYKLMVAIPVNKELPDSEIFLVKRMVAGKILVTEVSGGLNTTREAINVLETYMEDNHLISPAIYFESLITDRSKEPDTSKWVTRVFYPVM